ncbi:hypothetical protein QYE76_031983 [Lolium multiflorum]|uniref:Uncharacterized protein n=1 Tax=Lolium multiflorum TaxID=4521 RepID=A0AAD8QSM5_LOLMU|nr:hypothetical protein QYE76_031983 [Lolium multiflorum]
MRRIRPGPKVPHHWSRLDEVRAKLSSPLTAGADPTTVEKDLEAHRQLLLKQAEELAAAKRQLEINRREYDRAHGFTPAGDNPSRAGLIRRRGGGLGAEIARDGAESPACHGATRLQHPRQEHARGAAARAEPPRGRRAARTAGNQLINAATRAVDPMYATPPQLSRSRRCSTGRTRPRDTRVRSPHQAGTGITGPPMRAPPAQGQPPGIGSAAAAGHHQAGIRRKNPRGRR